MATSKGIMLHGGPRGPLGGMGMLPGTMAGHEGLWWPRGFHAGELEGFGAVSHFFFIGPPNGP
jgi:hypothetical protein